MRTNNTTASSPAMPSSCTPPTMPESPHSHKPPSIPPPPSITGHTSHFTRRIEIWRHEVASATALHPTPPVPAPLRTWQRFEKRILGKIWTGGKVKEGTEGNEGMGNGVSEEEPAEQTRMYEPTEREQEAGRGGEKRTEEWSWGVEGGRETDGSSAEGVERRRGNEKQARLERAAELLLRQRKMELSEEEEVNEVKRVVV